MQSTEFGKSPQGGGETLRGRQAGIENFLCEKNETSESGGEECACISWTWNYDNTPGGAIDGTNTYL